MAELIANNKKRLSISLSLFSPNDQNLKKSPKSFQPNRVVGLGIVAELTHDPSFANKSNRAAVFSVSPRSNPIPILSSAAKTGGPNSINGGGDDEMELSEEYTCVISHIGDNLIKKREYFDGVLANETHSTTSYWGGGGDEVAVAKAASFQAADFLKSCYLCKKHLHGLDIFMYRGEKAFCSTECRFEQMSIDEHKEKEKEKEKMKKKNRGSVGAGAAMMMTMMMNKPSFEFSSTTPCSSPMQLIAGVAAA